MYNLLYHDGRFSGLLDFQFAGWYREHLEYLGARYFELPTSRWVKVIGKAWLGLVYTEG